MSASFPVRTRSGSALARAWPTLSRLMSAAEFVEKAECLKDGAYMPPTLVSPASIRWSVDREVKARSANGHRQTSPAPGVMYICAELAERAANDGRWAMGCWHDIEAWRFTNYI